MHEMTCSVSDVIRLGRFGSLTLGCAANEVRSALGDPEEAATHEGKARIWKYGAFEILFDRDEHVASMELLVDQWPQESWPTIQWVDLDLIGGLSIEAILRLLQQLSVQVSKRCPAVGSSEMLFLPNRVKLGFELGKIDSLSVIDPASIP